MGCLVSQSVGKKIPPSFISQFLAEILNGSQVSLCVRVCVCGHADSVAVGVA